MRKFLCLTFVLSTFVVFAQKRVEYDLYVRDTIVNFAGKEKRDAVAAGLRHGADPDHA